MDLLRSINQNAHTITVGLMMNYENTLISLTPLISSLCSPFARSSVLTPEAHSSHRAATNTAPPSPVYHYNQQNPFQHLIFQTQNQQNQTKNNSKSTQKQLKINSNPIGKPIPNPTQNQPKIHRKKKKKTPKSLCFNHLHLHLHHLWSVKKKE